jgi:hypothetical protein
MRALIQQTVDERLAIDNELEIAGGILGIVAFIPGFNVLWALVLAFAALAVTIARELLEAAFDETIYDQIRCTFYCHIGTNGQMSQAQFDAVYADFANVTLYPDVITRLWVHSVMDLVGCVGLSDAGVALAAAADCDTCACTWCHTINFNDIPGDWFERLSGTGIPCYDWGAQWVDGQGWLNTETLSLNIELPVPEGTRIVRMAFHSDDTSSVSVATAAYINADLSGGVIFRVNDYDTGDIDYTMPADAYLILLVQPTGGAGICASHDIRNIDSVTVWGVGDDPFTDWDDC